MSCYILLGSTQAAEHITFSLEIISNFLSIENYYYYHLPSLPSFFLIRLVLLVLVLLQRYYTRITEDDKLMFLLGENLFF